MCHTGSMAEKMFSKKHYQNILDNRFNNPRIKYVSAEIKPISENAEGFMGEHNKLNITYELNGSQATETLFVKSKPTGKEQNEMSCSLNIYGREIFMYDFLFKEFEKHGYDTSFASKSYFCLPGEAIVMEDLTNKGFSLAERHKPFDMAKIKCLLKSLALYHAASLAYERKKSKNGANPFHGNGEYANYFHEVLYVMCINPSGPAMQFWNPGFQKFDTLVSLLPKKDEYKSELKRMWENYKIGQIFVDKTSFTKTCGHGDLWSNNMMFKCEDGVSKQCCLIDFQTIRYFYPAYDVSIAIYANTNAEFRSKHLTELHNYYYNTLSDVLHNYGYSIEQILPTEEFHHTLKLVKVEAVFQVFLTNTLIFLPVETLNNSVKGDENEFAKVMYNNNKEILLDMYNNNELFRNSMQESIIDIFDALKEVS